MKPAPVDFVAAGSLQEAVDLLAANDEAKVLAGGQSLIPLLNFRLASPELLVDINRIPDLNVVGERDGGVVMGATVRQATALQSELLGRMCPLVCAGLARVGHPQIRSRGTVVGSLTHHDPAAEMPAVAVALGARMVIQSARGRRTVDAEDFFISHYSTDTSPDEVVVEAWFPAAPPGTGAAFLELARRHGDFALVGVAAQVTLDAGVVSDARVAAIGVGERPVRCRGTEDILIGNALTNESVLAAAAVAAHEPGIHPADDIHATAEYRLEMVPLLVERAVQEAAEKARAATPLR